MKISKREILPYLLFAMICIAVLLPIHPWNRHYMGRDQGVFMYAGSQLLVGKVPYADIWDHKPPVIFFINAVGLVLGDGKPTGIWILQILTLFAAASLGYNAMQKSLNTKAAIFGTIVWMAALPFILDGGNMPEEFALLPQFFIIWFFFNSEKQHYEWLRCIGIGVALGLAFFTKQTSVGIGVIVILMTITKAIAKRNYKSGFLKILLITSGFFVVVSGWILYFWAKGALFDFWDAAFRFNFFYVSNPKMVGRRFEPLSIGMAPLLASLTLYIAALGTLAAGKISLVGDSSAGEPEKRVAVLALLGIPFELALVSTSGFHFGHYYLTMLPVIALLSGTFAYTTLLANARGKPRFIAISCLITIIAVIGLNTAVRIQKDTIHNAKTNYDKILGFIQKHTEQDDLLLVWGAEVGLNFYSGLPSPTRFAYQYPLNATGYTSLNMVNEFLTDIIANKPKYILNAKNPKAPMYYFPIEDETTKKLLREVRKDYEKIRNIDGFVVFERIVEN